MNWNECWKGVVGGGQRFFWCTIILCTMRHQQKKIKWAGKIYFCIKIIIFIVFVLVILLFIPWNAL